MNSPIQDNFSGSQNPTPQRGEKRSKQNGPFAVLAALAALLAIVGLSSCAGLTSAGKPGGGTPGPGILTASATTLIYGNVSVGSNSTQTLTFTNTGTGTVNITAAKISGTGFASSGGSPLTTILVGQSGTIQVRFAPPSTGAVTGTLTVASDAANTPLTISLTGSGTRQQQLTANPSSASFGSVITGSINSQTIRLTNSGTAGLTITQANLLGAGFSTTGLPLPTTIAAGGSTSFNIAFAPTTAGAVSGSVSLVSDAPSSPLAIPLSGTGTAATALLGANPSNLPFGIVDLTTNSSLATTVTNNGNTNISISSVNVAGSAFTPSGVSSGLTLTPNQSATLTVTFAPTVNGPINGSVTILSNAKNSPATLFLSGIGASPTSHSAGLTWNASSSTGVAGYFVYRGTVSGGPYSKLNSADVPTTSYSDSSALAGPTYFYVVTAVDASNVESAFSNEVTAVLP